MHTPDPCTPPPDTDSTGDVRHAFAKVWPYLQATVEFYARSLTADRDEREDLIQEGRAELWRTDASRCEIRSRHDLAYLRTKLTRHVRKVAVSKGLVGETAAEWVPDDLKRRLMGP